MAAARGGNGFETAHRELLEDDSIQFELQEAPQSASSLPTGGIPGAEILFWLIVGAAAILLLAGIASRLAGWRRPARADEAGDGGDAWQPQAGAARALLEEADALAAAGRYAEAAHLLLFRSIEEIDTRRPEAVRPALTSRDIAALPAIPPEPRAAFGRIVMMVERSLFARRPIGADDWRDCRRAYHAFALDGWGG